MRVEDIDPEKTYCYVHEKTGTVNFGTDCKKGEHWIGYCKIAKMEEINLTDIENFGKLKGKALLKKFGLDVNKLK